MVVPKTLAAANPIPNPQISDNDELYMIEILDILIQAKWVNVNVKNGQGNTPLLHVSRPFFYGAFEELADMQSIGNM